MFNTEEFAWKDVTIQIGDRVLTNIQGVTYKSGVEKEFLYGKGQNPLGIQVGNRSYSGELRLLQSEVNSLEEFANNGDLSSLKDLQVTIAYDKGDGTPMRADQLYGVTFVEVEKAINQNDKNMVISLPIMFLGIKYNV